MSRFDIVTARLIFLLDTKSKTKQKNIRENFKFWYDKNWRRTTHWNTGKIIAVYMQESSGES